jgi:hypothetical protein
VCYSVEFNLAPQILPVFWHKACEVAEKIDHLVLLSQGHGIFVVDWGNPGVPDPMQV